MKTARLLSLCTLLLLPFCAAPTHAATRPAPTVPVLMVSDIHFDPFHDPGKVVQLRAAPVTEWHALLAAPDTATQAADFAALQNTCKDKGLDTSYALLASSLLAEHAAQAAPVFVTVSGDLMAHHFDCRFRTVVPGRTEAEYAAFAAKTVAFVALELRRTFLGVPVYLALGNNDSGCKDYDEDPNSAFLREDARAFATDALSIDNASGILHEFPALGDASVALPAPFHHTRLLMLQDIFQSKHYAGCDGKSNDAAATQQVEWLRAKLEAARKAHEHVWVMAHIPPGVDAYSTFAKGRDVCSTKAPAEPEMFLGSEAFANILVDFPDVIRLALFAHTHMDEMRIYQSANGTVVPGKLVPSISPVDGNNPAFTIAQVDPATATLMDYTVYAAAGSAGGWGAATPWAEEYRYSTTYKLPNLSGDSLSKLTSSFLQDPAGTSPESLNYEKYYFVGGETGISAGVKAAAMHLVWPGYVCSLTSPTKAAFRACTCAPHPAPIVR